MELGNNFAITATACADLCRSKDKTVLVFLSKNGGKKPTQTKPQNKPNS